MANTTPLVPAVSARTPGVTDDLFSYKKVSVEELDLEHQVCQFGLRRWVGRTLHDLGTPT